MTDEPRTPTDDAPFRCEACEKTFETREALEIHVRRVGLAE